MCSYDALKVKQKYFYILNVKLDLVVSRFVGSLLLYIRNYFINMFLNYKRKCLIVLE